MPASHYDLPFVGDHKTKSEEAWMVPGTGSVQMGSPFPITVIQIGFPILKEKKDSNLIWL